MAKTTSDNKQKSSITLPNLNNWNVWLAFIHAIQGAVILLLSATKVFPVQTSYLTLDPISSDLAGHSVLSSATRHLFDVNLAYLVAIFFFAAAIAHGLAATAYRGRYEADLKKKVNKLRWAAYGLSGGAMVTAIAVLSGIADLSTLAVLFVLSIVAALLGLAMETYNQGKSKPNWLAYAIAAVVSLAPWFVLGVYVWGANIYGSGDIPVFVYWIYVSSFILFMGFPTIMYLQFKKSGKWADYLYSERSYMILSLVTQTLVAWQIFAGALRP
jgi:hypothetical protein